MDHVRLVGEILQNPDAEKPYEELARSYRLLGMDSCAEAVAFLLKERFGRFVADGSDTHEEQRRYDTEDS